MAPREKEGKEDVSTNRQHLETQANKMDSYLQQGDQIDQTHKQQQLLESIHETKGEINSEICKGD